MHPRLRELGWTPDRDALLATLPDEGQAPARVAVQHRGAYLVHTAEAEITAVVAGRLRHTARGAGDLPAVGDWVLVRGLVIQAVLPRHTSFSRKAGLGVTEEEVVAANVDTVFVTESLEGPLNLRRLERYLTLAFGSGAEPVVLLNKADLCADVASAIAVVSNVAAGVAVHALSARTADGLDALDRYGGLGRTVAFIGPSGVGKTSLVNAIAGGHAATAAVLADGRGRHTTTRRELVVAGERGIVIDTPGLRELQLWDAADGLDATFADIASLARACRFTDCGHNGEPGCAVRAAIDAGSLSAARLASLRKLEREDEHAMARRDARQRADARRELRHLYHRRRIEDRRPR